MAAELELAAWDFAGHKLWSRFVEPPWVFSVAGEIVSVDVMGVMSRIFLHNGKEVESGAVADGGDM